MRAIEEPRISFFEGRFHCICLGCGEKKTYSTKAAALLCLTKGVCRTCKEDYRDKRDQLKDSSLEIYKNKEGFWCSVCSGCGKEQAYTRKDHARSSSRKDWKCKGCASFENRTLPSFYKGFRLVDIESFEKNAIGRGLSWRLDKDIVPFLWEEQGGRCALSGVCLTKHPRTWSIDRIDSCKGYEVDNVQLVEKKINMMKQSYSQEEFIALCKAVAKYQSDLSGG